MLITVGNTSPIQTPLGATVAGSDVGVVTLDPLINHTTEIVVPDEHLADLDRLVAEVALAWSLHSRAVPGWLTVDPTNEEVVAALRAGLKMPPAPEGPTMLVTDAGHDFAAKQFSGSASATAVAKWIALTANTGDPAGSDTTLTGEITTASGGLVRAAGSYAHTTGTTTYTVSNTFTANGNDSLPVTVAKLGLFDASSTGNMVLETKLGTTATLSASGDTLAITWTITI